MFTTTNLYYNIASRLYFDSGLSIIHQTTIFGAQTIWFADRNNIYVLCNCETIPEDFVPEIAGEIENMLARREILIRPDKICLTFVLGYELSHAMKSIMDLFSSQNKIIKASFVELSGITLSGTTGSHTRPIEDALKKRDSFEASADREWFGKTVSRTYQKESEFFDRLKRIPYFTYGIAAILLGMYIYEVLFARMRGRDLDEVLVSMGAVTRDLIDVGEYWRLVSGTMLHGFFIHYLLNVYGLIVLGGLTEGFFGRKGLLFIYLTSAVAGSTSSYFLAGAPSVGASGAIFGLLGSVLYMALHSDTPGRIRKRLVWRIIYVIVLCAAPGLLLDFILPIKIDNWAHFGGLAGGFGSSFVFMRFFRSGKGAIEKTIAVAAGACFVISVVLAAVCAEDSSARKSFWNFRRHDGAISFRYPSFMEPAPEGAGIHYDSSLVELNVERREGVTLEEVASGMNSAGWKARISGGRAYGIKDNVMKVSVLCRNEKDVVVTMTCLVQTIDYLDWIPEFTAESVEVRTK